MRQALPIDAATVASLSDTSPADLEIAGVRLVIDPAGALWWPEEKLLAVADLHLEKGSSLARRGTLLPPYDTATTLARLSVLIDAYAPAVVLALGDSFHDRTGADRLEVSDRDALATLQRGRQWMWIAGNHDPVPVRDVGGECATALAIGALMWRHEPTNAPTAGEIAGHLHPVARIRTGERAIRRRCFVADATRVVMPAFGAYAGGLNVRDAAFASLFTADFTAHVLGRERIYQFAAAHCLRD
jgi:DNA ligase-associated metallophosphoesterase